MERKIRHRVGCTARANRFWNACEYRTPAALKRGGSCRIASNDALDGETICSTMSPSCLALMSACPR